jgi:hypothetical protein
MFSIVLGNMNSPLPIWRYSIGEPMDVHEVMTCVSLKAVKGMLTSVVLTDIIERTNCALSRLVIAVFHQIVLLGNGTSILSCLHTEHYGKQWMDCYGRVPIPLPFLNGLAYLKCRPPTDADVYSLPHLIMNADVDWYPTLYDNVILDLHTFYDQDIYDFPHGNYLTRAVATHLFSPEPEFFDVHEVLALDYIIDNIVDSLNPSLVEDIYQVNNLDVCNFPKDSNLLPLSSLGHRPILSRKPLPSLLVHNNLGESI